VLHICTRLSYAPRQPSSPPQTLNRCAPRQLQHSPHGGFDAAPLRPHTGFVAPVAAGGLCSGVCGSCVHQLPHARLVANNVRPACVDGGVYMFSSVGGAGGGERRAGRSCLSGAPCAFDCGRATCVCVGHVCSTLALRRTCVRDCSLCSVIPGQVRGDLRDFWRLALYPVVLVVCWLPGTINRVNNSLHPGTPMHARMFA
jgi:hypothetical protein